MSTVAPINFLDRYTIYSKSRDSDDTVLRDKQTDGFVLMKELLLSTNEEFKKIVETLEAQRSLKHEHLLTLVDYFTLGEVDEDQLSCHKVVTFFEYSTHNLLDEIEVRYSENRLFEETEVWSILCSSVLGLAYLQKESVGHGCISPIDIFIANDGTIQIVDPSIATSSPFVLQEGYYYSPQIMEYFRSPQEVATEDLDIFKSDVFSLGMCVLHAALLQSANDCFDYEQCTVDYELIHSKLALFSEHYPHQLTDLIASMLNEAPASRPDFIDLESQLLAMTQSKQSSATKSFGYNRPNVSRTLEQDKEDTPSRPEGSPNVIVYDSWVVDFNEDSNVKEENMKDFILHHVNQYSNYQTPINEQINIPKPVAKDTKLEVPSIQAKGKGYPKKDKDMTYLHPVQSNATHGPINSSFNVHQDQTQPQPPSIVPLMAQINSVSSLTIGNCSLKEIDLSNISVCGAQRDPVTVESISTAQKALTDCTPDKNTTTASITQQSSIRPFVQQSNSRTEQRNQEQNSARLSKVIESVHEKSIQQQKQVIPLQFKPPSNRTTIQIPTHPNLQPTLVQQTLTRIVQIQQTPIVQPQNYQQVVRTSHHLQQVRPDEVIISRTPVISKQIIQPRVGVSPRNYLGYRPSGCSDQQLFTDPALLTMMRQDVQRILSKSQLKNKENFPMK